MKIKELTTVIFDNVVIYKVNNEGFENIYKGNTDSIPLNVLEMKVRSIGATKKGVLDIQVYTSVLIFNCNK